jgi:hypothetical protein
MYWVGIKDGRVGMELVLYRLTRQTTFVYNGTSASLKDVDCLLMAKPVSKITTRRSASTVARLLGAAG